MDEIDDPVTAIKMIEDIGNQVSALRDEIPPLTMLAMSPQGPRQVDVLEDVLDTLDQCRSKILSEYGRMLWDSPDGPLSIVEREQKNVSINKSEPKPTVDQSHSKVNVPSLSSPLLAEVFEKARAEARAKALENGKRVQQSTGSVERERSRSLVRRILDRASGRKVRRSDS